MPAPSAQSDLRHNMRCSVIDGTLYMVMVGLAETFFALFVLELYRSSVASGLIVTIPMALASLLQVLAPWLVARIGTYKDTIAWCAVVQVLACVLLAGLALWPGAPIGALFAVATLYYAGAVVAGTPWSAMMGVMLPRSIRATFIGVRNRTLQLGAVVGVLAGAAALHGVETHAAHVSAWLARVGDGWLPPTLLAHVRDRPTLAVFAGLFLLAGAARAGSAYFLFRHREPAGASHRQRVLPPRELVRRLRAHGRWRLLGVLILFWFVMMIGSPFFAAYVREVAKVTFLQWALLTTAWFLGKAIAVEWAGRMATRRGRRWLLICGAFVMAPVPLLWGISTSFAWLLVAQVLAGVSIAIWESAVWLTTLEAFDEEERTSLLAKYNLLQFGAQVGGSLLGGAILGALSTRGEGQPALLWQAFFLVFLASTLARLGVAALITRTHVSGLPVAGR